MCACVRVCLRTFIMSLLHTIRRAVCVGVCCFLLLGGEDAADGAEDVKVETGLRWCAVSIPIVPVSCNMYVCVFV